MPVEPTAASLLRELSPDQQRDVLSRASARQLDKDDVLFHQDDPAEALYLVESGRLKLTQIAASGEAVTVRLTGPGELCAALAVLDGKSYPFTAVAAEPTRIRLWTKRTLRDLFQRCPRLEANILQIVGAHSREMLDRFRELATEPAPQRLARAVLRLASAAAGRPQGVTIEVTQQDLAELTATTLYTVNHILAEWQSAGILRRGRGRLLLLSESRLTQIAEGSER